MPLFLQRCFTAVLTATSRQREHVPHLSCRHLPVSIRRARKLRVGGRSAVHLGATARNLRPRAYDHAA